jgi:hypothetical protein
MSIRVRLTDEDLRCVWLWPRPLPMDGVIAAAYRLVSQERGRVAGARRVDLARARLALGILGLSGHPGFVDVHAESFEAAVDHLMSASRGEMVDDLQGLRVRGMRLPRWTSELADGDRWLRVELVASLRYVYSTEVLPELPVLAARAELAHYQNVQLLAGGGLDRLFGGLHARLRWLPPRTVVFTPVDPTVDFEVTSLGQGIAPGATTVAGGHADDVVA